MDVELTLAASRTESALFSLAAPVRIGRYVVLERIGSGAMGTVFGAYDPQIDRKVALKILRSAVGHEPDARARLAAEARALGRLAHPNVVAVHDVGTVGEGEAASVFVAMELVDGVTLATWFARRPAREETMHVMIQAGRGLAAAHAAGLVHRDFKPENVMVGADGRTRVMDFGLARPSRSRNDETLPALPDGSPMRTRPGTVVGTPAYMSPEQLEGRPADARSDQFAFCVVVWEALTGVRPFIGDTIVAILERMERGLDASAVRRVPRLLRPPLVRGLRFDPLDRHADMESLLRGLEAAPRRRRHIARTTVAALTVGSAIALWPRNEYPRPCELDPDRFADVWDDDVATELQAAFAASDRRHAADTFARAAAVLDSYVANWRDQWTEACEGTLRREHSEEVLDLRVACLERCRNALGSATRTLRRAPEIGVVDHALDIVGDLPATSRCADLEGLRGAYPPPVEAWAREEAAALEDGLRAVGADISARALSRARTELDPLLARAAVLEHPPVSAQAELREALLLRASADLEAADQRLRAATEYAATAHDDELLATAWTWRLSIAIAQARYDAAEALAETAEIAVVRAGSSTALTGNLANERGVLARRRGDSDAARALFEQARLAWTEAFGPDDSDVASATLNLGTVAEDNGELDVAEAHFREALATYQRALGAWHPRLALVHGQLGMLELGRGRLEPARVHLERALEIDAEALGDQHLEVGYDRLQLATLAEQERRCDLAIADFRWARDIIARTLGPTHPNVAAVEDGLGRCFHDLHRYDESHEHYTRALAIAEAGERPDQEMIAAISTNLGVLAVSRGRLAEARAYHERALAIRRESKPAGHPDIINSERNLAYVADAQGDHAEAEAGYTAALSKLLDSVGREHIDVATTHHALARVAIARHRGNDARRHFEEAIAVFVTLGGHDDVVAELRRELASVR